jgi:hypothetical protein
MPPRRFLIQLNWCPHTDAKSLWPRRYLVSIMGPGVSHLLPHSSEGKVEERFSASTLSSSLLLSSLESSDEKVYEP